MEGLAGIGRSAHDGIADLLLDRHGFAGQRRLVEHGDAFHDRSVDRHHVAFADHQPIARLDRLQVDLFEPAVPVSDGAARHAGEQRGHLAAGATLGKALEILPAGIHQRDHGGGEVFGKDQSRQHRERGDDIQAHVAAAQADRRSRSGGRPRTGTVAAAHIGPAQCCHPASCAASPMTRPGRRPYDNDRSEKRLRVSSRTEASPPVAGLGRSQPCAYGA